MNPNERLDLSDYPNGISPGNKRAIRKMIRTAIKFQNNRTLFSCRDCIFCSDIGCTFAEDTTAIFAQRMPHQLQECFMIDPIDTAFAGCLDLMNGLGIDFHSAQHGWATVVGRVMARANHYGYLMGVRRSNLDKYGP